MPKQLITTDEFDATALDVGKPVNIIFGDCRNVPLWNIQNDTTNNQYDYLIGYGTIEGLWLDSANGIGVKRDGILVHADEYTAYDGSQGSPYSGYAFIRFIKEQKSFSSGYHKITADVKGLELGGASANHDFEDVIDEFLSDTTWGLSESVDATSITNAGTALAAIGNMFCDGAITEQRPARDILADILLACRGRVQKGADGEWELYIDGTGASTADFGDNDGYYNNCQVSEIHGLDVSQFVRTAHANYDFDFAENRPFYTINLAVNTTSGEDQTYDLIFIRNVLTVKHFLSYIKNRSIYSDQQPQLTLTNIGMEGRDRTKGDIITVHCASKNINSQEYIIQGISKGLASFTFQCREYSASIFSAVTITSPTTSTGTDTGWGAILETPYLTVSPTPGEAQYQTIVAALAALPAAGGRILLKDGTYAQTAVITMPDKIVEIMGESQEGVTVQNNDGDILFYLNGCTKEYWFHNFSIESQNTASYTAMFGITGATNNASVTIERVKADCVDNGTVGDTGTDYFLSNGIGVSPTGASAQIIIKECISTKGEISIYGYPVVQVLESELYNNQQHGIKLNACGNATITGTQIIDFEYMAIYAFDGTGSLHLNTNTISCVNVADVDALLKAVYALDNVGVQILGNVITLIHSDGTSETSGIILIDTVGAYTRPLINGNTISINISSTNNTYALKVNNICGGSVSQNTIKMDNDNATGNHFGLYLYGALDTSSVKKNVVQGNYIDGVNNKAKDRGIDLNANTSYNDGENNIIHLCGTKLTDAGAGNLVAASW